MKKTPSKTSPRSSNRGCICKDGSYSKDCCDGSLQAQGIGSLVNQSSGTTTNEDTERTTGSTSS